MKKQHLLFLCLTVLTLAYSCKKNDDDTTTTNSGTNTSNEDNSGKVTGYLSSTYTKVDTTFPIAQPFSALEEATAIFYPSRKDTIAIAPDTVYVNGLALPIVTQGQSKYHYQTNSSEPLLNMGNNCYWQVIDTSYDKYIPDFSYNFSTPYPAILGSIPDTASKEKGLNLNIKIGGADSVSIQVYGDTSGSARAGQLLLGAFEKTFDPADNVYYYTPDEIKKCLTSNLIGVRVPVIINTYKTIIKEFEGRYFKFTKTYIYYGGIWIKK